MTNAPAPRVCAGTQKSCSGATSAPTIYAIRPRANAIGSTILPRVTMEINVRIAISVSVALVAQVPPLAHAMTTILALTTLAALALVVSTPITTTLAMATLCKAIG